MIWWDARSRCSEGYFFVSSASLAGIGILKTGRPVN